MVPHRKKKPGIVYFKAYKNVWIITRLSLSHNLQSQTELNFCLSVILGWTVWQSLEISLGYPPGFYWLLNRADVPGYSLKRIDSRVPTGRNVFTVERTKADSLLLIPRSPLAVEDLCPAILVGTEHLVFPVLQPTPYVSRCRGQTITDAWVSLLINTPKQWKIAQSQK